MPTAPEFSSATPTGSAKTTKKPPARRPETPAAWAADGVDAAAAALRYPISELTAFHRNPRRGNVEAIADSLKRTGQYRPVVVNRGNHTGRTNEILAGNHTVAAARALGWHAVSVVFLDVDDETATRIVLADNRLADLGDYELPDLAGLLGDLGADLDGTGYTPYDLDGLVAELSKGAPSAKARTAPEHKALSTHYRCPSCDFEWEGNAR